MRNGNFNNRQNVPQAAPGTAANNHFGTLPFQPSWITEGANKELVVYAEDMGKWMADKKLTSSKIRNVYSEIKRIQMDYANNRSSFYLLKPKVAYAVGRDQQNEGLRLFQLVFNAAADCVTDERTYKNFCNLIEAVLAYHKAYVKNDK